MSCRIDRLVTEADGVCLFISGRIRAGDVEVAAKPAWKRKSAVAIDLKDVLLVERKAVKLLSHIEADGIELRNCPAYIREWVSRERVRMTANRRSQRQRQRRTVKTIDSQRGDVAPR
jgi:hypothetical protein